MNIINDRQLKNLVVSKKTFVKDASTKNLYIEARVRSNGEIDKNFYFRYKQNKKAYSIKIGKYPQISLADAREKANQFNSMLILGEDPKASLAKTQTEIITLQNVFDEWCANNTSYNSSHRLKLHVISKIGNKDIKTLSKEDIFPILDRLKAENKFETLIRIFRGIKKILLYAMNREYIEYNNIINIDIKTLYGSYKKQNLRAITDEERFKELLLAIENYNGNIFTKVALQISPYLFLRSANIRNLEWNEIDFKNSKITIPANKMKGGEEFVVPLSNSVIKLLEFIKPFSFHHSKYVFPSDISKSKTISENTLNQAIKRLGFGEEMVFHGFRTTASTLLYEFKNLHGQDSEVIELCLDHRERNKVKAAYNRSLRLSDRRFLMEWWAEYINKLKGEI
ncbi:site-specific integrase [Campylobacter novaezeelandiae]|uniref:tyrosine-type recombinase/integrase n=1 Tax=Campylobacter novaezeelandiae TaxID=2267891 RepID=UPI001037FD28|nr:site-specific integrase [Campylobacter novaezeelandiae]TBR80901.1 site-specific integrase [Campylobacter novaezeelandiae]